MTGTGTMFKTGFVRVNQGVHQVSRGKAERLARGSSRCRFSLIYDSWTRLGTKSPFKKQRRKRRIACEINHDAAFNAFLAGSHKRVTQLLYHSTHAVHATDMHDGKPVCWT